MTLVNVDKNGRVLVPAEVRRRMGLSPGTELLLTIEDGRLLLDPREAAWQRVRDLFAQQPRAISVVDDLIAERRQAAMREDCS